MPFGYIIEIHKNKFAIRRDKMPKRVILGITQEIRERTTQHEPIPKKSVCAKLMFIIYEYNC